MSMLTTADLEEILESVKKPGIRFFDVIEFGHEVAKAALAAQNKAQSITDAENRHLNDAYVAEYL